jgi:aspartate/methionine/tyrosine aminotransferase
MLRVDDREWLVSLAKERGLALISDEVFADYPLGVRSDTTSLLCESRALTFTLGGLSKSAGLPQMKLAWIVVSGPDRSVASALERLELVADSYLSVSTPVQLAAPALIHIGRAVRAAIRQRVRFNLDALRRLASDVPALSILEPDGGWTVVVRVPAILSEDQWVLRLLDAAGVLVHPGYFFDFDVGTHLVISLLPQPAVFEQGVSRVVGLTREMVL